MTGEPAKKALMKSEDRRVDLALLRDLAKSDDLTEDESDAFGDMRDALEDGSFATMTEKQRKWARDVAERLGIAYERLSSEKAENVLKGRDVKLVGVLSPDSLKSALAARRR